MVVFKKVKSTQSAVLFILIRDIVLEHNLILWKIELVKFCVSTTALGNLWLFGVGFLGEGLVVFSCFCGCFSPDLLLFTVNPTYRWNH